MQQQITPESQQMKGLFSVSALHLYSGGGSGRSRKGFLGALYKLILQVESALIMLVHELNITPPPSTLLTRWMGGASTADYSIIYVALPRETSPACPKPFIFHRFWNELILSIAMKPDKHTLYFSSTSSEHHHIIPLAPFQSIFPVTTAPVSRTFEGQVEAAVCSNRY